LAEFIGESRAAAALRQTLQRLVERQTQARRPVPILLLGETGVGKSMAARVLHRAGPRAAGPYVDVNCAAIPPSLLEAELFGFERGAFTDAKQAKPGLLEAAHGGILFLDEVGLLPEESQAKLLKVLEEGTVRRLGGTRTQSIDVWIIAATSEDLEAASRRRRFRADLYHRLAVITVRLPALRERQEDIVPLAGRFLADACADVGLPVKTLTADAQAALRGYAWPGNIRELRNVVTRAVLLTETAEVSSKALQLSSTARPEPAEPTEPEAGAEVEAQRIAQVLRETGWNVSRAATRLGLARSALRYRIDKHGLSPERASASPSAAVSAMPRTGPAAMTTLPLPMTSLVGRERELHTLALRLARHRVVTLTGTGGVGKTRLALAAGPLLRTLCPDGVWFVELASGVEGALVAQTVASVLGLPEEAARSPLEVVTAALAGRRALLILDNCEHLVGACAALVGTLVSACPDLRVLVTSRERLNIPGESIFQVPPLALPGLDAGGAAELMRFEAVRLFVERARLVDPEFALTAENASAVIELCRRLDGLPLAIELAAARVRLLSVEQIVARLNDRFRLLTGGSRTTIARQQTLRAALDWSHDLLAPAERTLLRRLSVFAGGFTLEAVEAVCSGSGVEASQVLDLLGQLVDKSLLVVEAAAPFTRYRLLETIWEYGREQAIAAGEVTELRARHQAWFLALAEEAEVKFRGAEQVASLDRLETEYDNLQAALSWRDQDGAEDPPRLRLAAALWRFWEVRGRIREGRGWLEGILAETGRAAPFARVRALNGAGNLARGLGDYAQAEAHHAEALALRREMGEPRGIAVSLNNLGVVAHDRARYGDAEAYLVEAIQAWRKAGDQEGLALSLNNLGRARRFQGDYDGAAGLCRESLRLYQVLGHSWGIGRALNSLANSAHYQGDVAAARSLYEQSLELRRHVGDRQGIAVVLNSLALLKILTDDLDSARWMADEALALRRDLGDRRGIGSSLLALAQVALRASDLDRAERLARESLAIRSDVGDRLGLVCCLETLADVALQRGQHARAARLLRAAASERASIAAPLPPLEQDHHARVMAALRENLGEQAVEAASSETFPESLLAEELTPGSPAAPLSPPAAATRGRNAPPDVIAPRPTPRDR
jgi:non-specific serine/threonine protein kinase